VLRDWRKLHNEELHNSHSLPAIIRMMTSRRVRWAGHLVRIAWKMPTRFWLGNMKERDHLVNLGLHERLIIKCVSNKMDGIVWTRYFRFRIETSDGL
jgi:hypothetical protein